MRLQKMFEVVYDGRISPFLHKFKTLLFFVDNFSKIFSKKNRFLAKFLAFLLIKN